MLPSRVVANPRLCVNLYTALPICADAVDGCCFSVARGVWVLYSQDFVCTFHCCCIGAACPAGVRLGASSKQRLTIGNLKLVNHLVVCSRLSNCQILSVQLHQRGGDLCSQSCLALCPLSYPAAWPGRDLNPRLQVFSLMP